MRVLLTKEVKLYFLELIELLYEKDYFGFEDAAFDYVNDLIRDITISLPRKLKKKAPSYFDKYGKELHYAVYKKNRNTQWYVFFQYENGIYLVRYIGNNHSISQYL
ncbi:hypothetical protein D0T84_03790 [Dysgonomonas sp. 521]|uniref:hypothetical protein n=1 Tax=Dysgonomonas sp. 521 TaxID=2302932 RepID=UPI0013D23CE6|nr:hypothetical protein [Dysgonomonas sp. 521]NDV94040.1 hypothetical protein [Dysgonomonas sp. 521]